MAIDTVIAYVGVYDSVDDAEADYQLVKDLHTEADLIDAYDAAVVERTDDGKVKIVKKHETPDADGRRARRRRRAGDRPGRRAVPVRRRRRRAARRNGRRRRRSSARSPATRRRA